MRIEWKLLLAFIGFCVLAIFVAYFAENIRGAKRLEEVIAMAKAEGVSADVPMPLKSSIPEEENFFHGPLIGSLSDFRMVGSIRDGSLGLEHRDPDEVKRIRRIGMPYDLGNTYGRPPLGLSGIESGEMVDVEWWAKLFQIHEDFEIQNVGASSALQCLEAIDARFGAEIDFLVGAASRPHAEIPMFRSDGEFRSIGRFSGVSWYVDDLLDLMLFRFIAAVEAGEWETAYDSVDVVLVFLSGFCGEKQLGSSLFAGECVSKLSSAIWNGIVMRKFGREELTEIQHRLESISFAKAVESGFAGTIRDKVEFFEAVKNDRRVSLYGHHYPPPPAADRVLRKTAPHGWYDLNAATVVGAHLMEGYIPWRDEDFSLFASADSRVFVSFGIDSILLRGYIGPSARDLLRLASAHIDLKQTIIACALERFRLEEGTLPRDLDELVPEFIAEVPNDPFDGRAMRFSPEGDQFAIYSIGSDCLDDNGYVSRGHANRRNRDSGDWVWSFETYINERQALDREKAMFRISLEEAAGEQISYAEFLAEWRSKLVKEEAVLATEKERQQALMLEKAHQRVEEDRAKLRKIAPN